MDRSPTALVHEPTPVVTVVLGARSDQPHPDREVEPGGASIEHLSGG